MPDMNRWLSLIAFALTSCATAPPAPPPAPRVEMVTNAGTITIRLVPELAPRTVEQFLKLVRGGVYDSMFFYRVEQGFVAQTAMHDDRENPLTPEQRALIVPIPLEQNDLKHQRGVLSLAHGDDPNSGETSFSIVLADAPHLDGQYTTFGVILDSEAVLKHIEETYNQEAYDAGGNRLRIIRMTVK
jgi:cyclophilin family peptidyl-prolyl cis-trans isomerase